MAKKKKKVEVVEVAASPVSDDKWKAENDADTLMRAGEICADEERLGKARKVLKVKKKAFRSVQDLIDYRNSGGSDDESED